MQLAVREGKLVRMKRLNVISLKMVREKTFPYATNIIRSPLDVFKLAREFLGEEDREHCVVLCLDTKNKITAVHTVSVGTLNSACVHPREVFKICILANSASFILLHNHPSNDTTPSPEDIQLTQRVKDAGELIGIELLDHVIISQDSHFSLKEHGFM
jgi:DNA repair protein RadC